MGNLNVIVQQKRFQDKAPYLKIRGIIRNSQDMRQTSFTFECRIDTGFDGGVTAPITFISDLETIGVIPVLREWTLANGQKVPVHICAAYLIKIENTDLPTPGLPVRFIILGTDTKKKLLGMDAMKYLVTEINGINQHFSVSR